MAGRGELTQEIQEVAKKMIGREISLRELRLIPYIQYTLCNSRRIELKHINEEERHLIGAWRGAGWIEGGASEMVCSKLFWDFMCEVLFLAYANCD